MSINFVIELNFLNVCSWVSFFEMKIFFFQSSMSINFVTELNFLNFCLLGFICWNEDVI
jgi:hypothetical protein